MAELYLLTPPKIDADFADVLARTLDGRLAKLWMAYKREKRRLQSQRRDERFGHTRADSARGVSSRWDRRADRGRWHRACGECGGEFVSTRESATKLRARRAPLRARVPRA